MVLGKRSPLRNAEETAPKKGRVEVVIEGKPLIEEDEDIAKLYIATKNISIAGAGLWKLDDNQDQKHSFFQTNPLPPPSRYPTSEEFQSAMALARQLEEALNGIYKMSRTQTAWHGFVVAPAFENQEAQQSFEEALGLPEALLEAESGLYYEDLEEDSIMFVQEEEDLESYSEEDQKKLEAVRDLILEQLTDCFTVGFCSEVEECLYPEFWGGETEDGLLVGVFATIHPLPLDPAEEKEEEADEA